MDQVVYGGLTNLQQRLRKKAFEIVVWLVVNQSRTAFLAFDSSSFSASLKAGIFKGCHETFQRTDF
jgi:hypothetical protein